MMKREYTEQSIHNNKTKVYKMYDHIFNDKKMESKELERVIKSY